MDAVFFVCAPEAARQVRSIDDVGEPAGDPLAVESPGALAGLISALDAEPRSALRQLRDATCQSFPIWTFAGACTASIAALDDDQVDAVAARWLAADAAALPDADPYQLALCLGALRDALHGAASDARLFVLLEEKAW